jgi:Icc-related predicted phosphoesterase
MSVVRIVAISDTHGHHAALDPLPEGDVLVHCGDITNVGERAVLEDFVGFLAAQPHPHKVVIAGNHDWCFAREAEVEEAEALLRSEAIYLFDSGVTVCGLRFYGSPWQPWFLDWAFNLRRGEELAAKWAQIPDDTDILLTHGPPANIGDRCFDERRVGCVDLRARIREVQPLVHLFGHIHEAAGVWQIDDVTFVNASCELAESASVIDVDVETRRVLEAKRLRRDDGGEAIVSEI